MRTAVIAVLVAMAGALAAQPAEAGGRARVSVGVGFGYPFWGPPFWGPSWYYPPPYYYYPAPTVVVPSQPITYVEQGVSDQSGWWYYCDASRGYYPYVKECPSGWQRVPPAPPK